MGKVSSNKNTTLDVYEEFDITRFIQDGKTSVVIKFDKYDPQYGVTYYAKGSNYPPMLVVTTDAVNIINKHKIKVSNKRNKIIYFSINGKKLKSPKQGIYIKKIDSRIKLKYK